jgi:RimJ/RimL family protein N-acetyltransferase
MRILSYRGHWALMGFGYWALEEKATGQFVGELGFAEYRRDIAPSIEGIPELGWVLISGAHGKGYATEALRAAVAWGDAHFDSARTVCIIHPDNRASFRVADKLGYKEIYKTTDSQPHVVLARSSASSD